MPFRSKKRTTVGTSSSPLIDRGDPVEDFFVPAILQYIMRDSNLSEELIQALVDSSYYSIRKAMRYARDGYFYGLPNFSYISSSTGKEAVEGIIQDEIGATIKTHYYKLTDWNLFHRTFYVLQEEWGFNSNSNEIERVSNDMGYPCYLKDFRIVVTEQTSTESDPDLLSNWGVVPQYGYAPSRRLNKTGRSANFRGSVTPVETEEGTKIESSTFEGDDEFDPDDPIIDPYEGFEETDEYAEVTFEYEKEVERTVEIEQDDGSVIETQRTSTEVFEGSIIINHGRVGAHKDGVVQVLYEYEKDGDTYYGWWSHELEENRSPLDDLILSGSGRNTEMFPIVPFRMNRKNTRSDLGSDSDEVKSMTTLLDRMGLDYRELSRNIHNSDDIQYVEQAVMMFGVSLRARSQPELQYLWHFFDRVYQDLNGSDRGSTGSVSINFRQRDFKARTQFDRIRRSIHKGSIGPVGTYTRTDGKEPYEVTFRRCRDGRGDNPRECFDVTRTEYIDGVEYNRQVTDNTYVTYHVREPVQTYNVWRGYDTSATSEDDHFLIPMDFILVDNIGMSIREKNEVYMRSIHFVFNARRTQKVRWYQRGFFRFVLTVAAVAITIYTGGATWQAIAAAAAVGTVAVVIAVIKIIVISLAVRYGFQFVAEQVGAEWAMILATVAAVAGGYQAFNHGSIQGAPWASELLQVSAGLAEGANAQIMSDIRALQRDAKAFQQEMEEKTEALEEAESLLERSGAMDPFDFLSAVMGALPNEMPDFFYQRTVHSGNIGVMALDAPSNFVESMLHLPYAGDPATL